MKCPTFYSAAIEYTARRLYYYHAMMIGQYIVRCSRSTQRHDKYFRTNMICPSIEWHLLLHSMLVFFSLSRSLALSLHLFYVSFRRQVLNWKSWNPFSTHEICIVSKLKTFREVENFPGEKIQSHRIKINHIPSLSLSLRCVASCRDGDRGIVDVYVWSRRRCYR